MLKIEEQIIKHEGFRPFVYKCTTGKLTVGYGRNLEDCGITQNEARILLKNDIAECETDLYRIFGKLLWDLGDNRYHALIDMRFNLGPAGFRKFKRMIRAIKAKNFDLVAQEMKDSFWYYQVKGRASTLYKMVLKGGNE